VTFERPGDLAGAIALATDDQRVVSLVGGLVATAEDRHSLVGAADVSLTSPDLRFSRPQRVALMRPSSLRIEVLGLFNQVAAILTTDGSRYQLYDATRPEIEEGRARPGLLWQVARVDLEPDEAIDLLLGAPLDARSRVEAAHAGKDGRIRIAFRSPVDGGLRIFEFDAESRLSRVRQWAADGLLWEAVYDDYRPVGDRSFAHEIEIRFPDQEARASFRFTAAELNPDLPPSAFVLPHHTP
jgi:hypothetical protein